MSEVYEEVSFSPWGTKSTSFLIDVGGVQYRAGEVRDRPDSAPLLILDGLTASNQDSPDWLYESLDTFHEGQRRAVQRYKEAMDVYLGR